MIRVTKNAEEGRKEMTQIRGFIGATRRPGELGIHSLDGFNLVVPDMKIAETFYDEFGLELRGAATESTFTRIATVTAGARLSKVPGSGCLISASALSKMTSRVSKNG
jgi:hypothetical protein